MVVDFLAWEHGMTAPILQSRRAMFLANAGDFMLYKAFYRKTKEHPHHVFGGDPAWLGSTLPLLAQNCWFIPKTPQRQEVEFKETCQSN
jgi:hypothetical protein